MSATMGAAAARAFVKEHGVVLVAANGPVPKLTEAIAGEPIVGSWWGHRKGHEIYAVLEAVTSDEDVLVCRAVNGKVTLVHRRRAPRQGRTGAHRVRAPRQPRDAVSTLGERRGAFRSRGDRRGSRGPSPRGMGCQAPGIKPRRPRRGGLDVAGQSSLTTSVSQTLSWRHCASSSQRHHSTSRSWRTWVSAAT